MLRALVFLSCTLTFASAGVFIANIWYSEGCNGAPDAAPNVFETSGVCVQDSPSSSYIADPCTAEGKPTSVVTFSGTTCEGEGTSLLDALTDIATNNPNECSSAQAGAFYYEYNCTVDVVATGACCGPTFCYSAIDETNCTRLNGTFSDTETCGACSFGSPPLQGANGVEIVAQLGLSNAGTTLGPGQNLEVKAASGAAPQLPGGPAVIVFQINRVDADGNEISDYTNLGEWFDVALTSDPAFTGAENLAVFRQDGANWVLSTDDCTHNPPALDAAAAAPVFSAGAWNYKICHTSTFALGGADDGDDKDTKDPKGKKLKTPKKETKVKAKTEPKAKDFKDPATKKGKKASVVGGAVGGGLAVVGLAGAGAYIRRRNNKKKTGNKKAGSVAEQAVVVSI